MMLSIRLAVSSMIWTGMVFGDVVGFDEPGGYYNAQIVTNGLLYPVSAGFEFVTASNTDSSVSAVVSNETLFVQEGFVSPEVKAKAAAWARDVSATVYDDIVSMWYRSVDVLLSPLSVTADSPKVSVVLLNGDCEFSDSVNWVEYASNVVLSVSFTRQSESSGQFILQRINASGGTESYNYYTDQWSSSGVNYSYDLSHKITVLYSYNPHAESNQFSVSVYDLTSSSLLYQAGSDVEDMADFVGGSNSVRFCAGDLWLNSGHSTCFQLDHIESSPEERKVSFSLTDGYTSAETINNDLLLPETSGFRYISAVDEDCTVTAVITNESLSVTEAFSSPAVKAKVAAWVRDENVTVYDSLIQPWCHAVDLALDPLSITSDNPKICAALLNGACDVSDSVDWVDYAANFVLAVSVTKQSDTVGQFMLQRINSVGAVETYNFYNKSWGSTSVNCSYDLSHTITVRYIYDPQAETNQFTVAVSDRTAVKELYEARSDTADMAEFVGGTNSMQFCAGDLWLNSGHSAVFTLDNIESRAKPGYYVEKHKGVPAVFHLGRPVNLNAYYNLTSTPVQGESEGMTAAGVDVHHLLASLYWAEHYSNPDDPMNGLDYRIRQILEMNPDARFLLNIGSYVPESWINTETNELHCLEDGSIPKIRQQTRSPNSFASKLWLEEVGVRLRTCISFLKEQDYYDRIIGIHMLAGDEGQWTWWRPDASQYEDDMNQYYYLNRQLVDHSPAMTDYFRNWLYNRYNGSDAALQSSWGDANVTLLTAEPPSEAQLNQTDDYIYHDPTAGNSVHIADYFTAFSQARLDAVNYFGQIIKDETKDNPKLYGAYYGAILYQYIGGNRNVLRHLFNYEHLLDTPWIDYFVSPPFHGSIEVGGAAFHHLITDSFINAGKYLLLENDIATHLKVYDWHAFDTNSPTTLAGSLDIYKRSMAYLLSRRMGVWWWDYEFTTGCTNTVWWDAPEFWEMFSAYSEISRDSFNYDCSSVAQIAVIYSDKTGSYLENEAIGITRDIVMEQLPELLKIGAPIDLYTTSDIPEAGNYQLYIIWNAFYLSDEERSDIQSKCCTNDSTVLWLYAPGVLGETGYSESNMTAIAGMQITFSTESENIRTELINSNHPITADYTNQVFGSQWDSTNRDRGYVNCIPLYKVSDAGATVLGQYSCNDDASLAVKEHSNWNSIFCGTYPIPAWLLRSIADYAGVHLYVDRSCAVYANASYLGIELPENISETIALPSQVSEVIDLFGGSVVASNTASFQVQTTEPETRLYRIVP